MIANITDNKEYNLNIEDILKKSEFFKKKFI